jgi:hypothetical protein
MRLKRVVYGIDSLLQREDPNLENRDHLWKININLEDGNNAQVF